MLQVISHEEAFKRDREKRVAEISTNADLYAREQMLRKELAALVGAVRASDAKSTNSGFAPEYIANMADRALALLRVLHESPPQET